MRRFVVPCLPAASAIAELYEEMLHSRLLAICIGRLRHITASRDDAAHESDIVHIITWYARYGREFGRGHSEIELLLEEEHRRTLLDFMRSHVVETIRFHFCGICGESRLRKKSKDLEITASDFPALLFFTSEKKSSASSPINSATNNSKVCSFAVTAS